MHVLVIEKRLGRVLSADGANFLFLITLIQKTMLFFNTLCPGCKNYIERRRRYCGSVKALIFPFLVNCYPFFNTLSPGCTYYIERRRRYCVAKALSSTDPPVCAYHTEVCSGMLVLVGVCVAGVFGSVCV